MPGGTNISEKNLTKPEYKVQNLSSKCVQIQVAGKVGFDMNKYMEKHGYMEKTHSHLRNCLF